jgi:hypothetical protein
MQVSVKKIRYTFANFHSETLQLICKARVQFPVRAIFNSILQSTEENIPLFFEKEMEIDD